MFVEERTPILEEDDNTENKKNKKKNNKQSVFSIIGNYCKLPKFCDWVIAGLIIICVIATIILICIP
jgi:hypothetical protein